MGNPIETLDACSAKLAEVQAGIAKTRKVACVVSGVAVAGGFALLLHKLLAKDEPPEPVTEATE